MPPGFSKNTIDTLAKRAAYKCSNPDCRKNTVGPNSDPEKSTIIGEAAHIYGAREGGKRFNVKMTDNARAEITNGIWLCRNCHKLIDTDEKKYKSEVLFLWREQHEQYVLSVLGNSTSKIQFEQLNAQLKPFENYPPLIRRIVIDKPEGWEWRLTAELMRHLNSPIFRKFDDLRNGLYVKSQEHISGEQVLDWIRNRLTEFSNLIDPICKLIEQLNKSWGESGKSGNADEIHHICCLIRDSLEQILLFEEQIYFTNAPAEYQKVFELMKDILSSQADKLDEIPDSLDEAVSLISSDNDNSANNVIKIEKTIEFNLPRKWEKNIVREFKRAEKIRERNQGLGFWQLFLLGLLILIVFIMIL